MRRTTDNTNGLRLSSLGYLAPSRDLVLSDPNRYPTFALQVERYTLPCVTNNGLAETVHRIRIGCTTIWSPNLRVEYTPTGFGKTNPWTEVNLDTFGFWLLLKNDYIDH